VRKRKKKLPIRAKKKGEDTHLEDTTGGEGKGNESITEFNIETAAEENTKSKAFIY